MFMLFVCPFGIWEWTKESNNGASSSFKSHNQKQCANIHATSSVYNVQKMKCTKEWNGMSAKIAGGTNSASTIKKKKTIWEF